MLQIHAWSHTDVGRKRKHNEDFLLVDPSVGLFGVADGMGGYEAGEVASKMVLEGLQQKLRERPELFSDLAPPGTSEKYRRDVRDFLDRSVQELSYQIFSMAQRQGGDFRMGTTLCALVTLKNIAAVIHVGDSRCYLWRTGQVYQATEDHSLVVEQLKSGVITPEEAASSRYKNVITRAVGMADRLQVDLFFVDLQAGDRFLLCSDGLHGYFRGDELGHYLAQDELAIIPRQLIDLANQRGGKDNITGIVVSVEGDEEADFVRQDTQISTGVHVLRSNPLFASMTYPEILKTLPLTLQREFGPGDVVMREGDPATHMYIVEDGSLDIFREGELIANLQSGSYVGEMGIFDREPCSATVIAREPTRCLAMAGDALMSLLRQEPDIGFKIQQSLIVALSQRLRDTSHALAWTRQEWRRSIPQGIEPPSQ
ncbi:MAG TPA: protein phosphatase [Myxococcales bacterium]|nr:protein phosphatase [Deltaproteobacteria bacterium]MBU54439.1 protein phosphatase [Deltaproteobacteria bacterium]HAA57738.1 protein phosphatase [Myxococcales bacterium]